MTIDEFIEPFTASYAIALLFSETDSYTVDNDGQFRPAENGESRSLADDFDLDDIADTNQIESDCRDFVLSEWLDLARLCDHASYGRRDPKVTARQAGHDFALTRNRHGAGFWDRGLGDLGARLTKAAHPHGTQGLQVGDDGKLHVQG